MTTIPWLGPVNYPIVAAKHAFDITLGKMFQASPSSSSDIEVPYFKSVSVQWRGVQPNREIRMWATPTERRSLAVRTGDLLICEGGDVGRSAVYDGPDGFIFEKSVHRARPIGGSNTRYLWYVLHALHSSEWLDVLCNKATIRHLTGEKLGALEVPLPPQEEQLRIANFLDAETARIDKLIAKRHQQIELLTERRTAALAECVSSSNSDSFLHPLVGAVSHSWPILPLRRVIPAVNVGVVINPSSHFTDEGIPFVHGFNVRHGWIDQQGMKFISVRSNEELSRSRIYSGDVLVVRAGSPGRAAVVTEEFDGANCASVLILRQGQSILPQFLSAFINSPAGRGQVQLSQYGAAQEVISAAQTLSFVIPVPNLGEQQYRVDRLTAALDTQSRVLSKLQHQVSLLAERRQALITAAVTGQFDVSTASGRNVTEGVAV
ncbi:restriction endonuclease subunit S [Streptomyces prasinus]|uniref:restriction endonuclease subunit S n=1 Tax=Streptomyces prasinus TaxID=67345 RepID=UPI0036C79017